MFQRLLDSFRALRGLPPPPAVRKAAPEIKWPQSLCRVCGKPTIDEGGFCSDACLAKHEGGEGLALPEVVGSKFVIANGEKRFLAQALARLDDVEPAPPTPCQSEPFRALRGLPPSWYRGAWPPLSRVLPPPPVVPPMTKQVRETLLLSYALRLHFDPDMRKDPAGDGQADLIRHVFCHAYDIPRRVTITRALRLHTSSDIMGKL